MPKSTYICPICQKEFVHGDYPSFKLKLAPCCSRKCAYSLRSQVKARPAKERFLEKVVIDEITGCWNWTGSRGGYKSLYGVFGCIVDGKWQQFYAHRWSYEHFTGPVPEGLVLDHLCRNTICVNPAPDHLEPVTNKENVLRGESDQAKRARQTHCIHGHPFDEANTYITSDGYRKCKACGLARDRVRRPAKTRD